MSKIRFPTCILHPPFSTFDIDFFDLPLSIFTFPSQHYSTINTTNIENDSNEMPSRLRGCSKRDMVVSLRGRKQKRSSLEEEEDRGYEPLSDLNEDDVNGDDSWDRNLHNSKIRKDGRGRRTASGRGCGRDGGRGGSRGGSSNAADDGIDSDASIFSNSETEENRKDKKKKSRGKLAEDQKRDKPIESFNKLSSEMMTVAMEQAKQPVKYL
ncbi:hypothetical protein M426DRAFT_215507 [Hypoxylon sp. CI-4A]|nr:hypothetical protein M426DRAFT_215507 [Hypoxylon sp. CI-4A]